MPSPQVHRLLPNSGIPSWRLNSVWIFSSWLQSICCCSGDGTLPGAGYKQKDWNLISSLKPELMNMKGYCLWVGGPSSKRSLKDRHSQLAFQVTAVKAKTWKSLDSEAGWMWKALLTESWHMYRETITWKNSKPHVTVPFHKPTGLPNSFSINPRCVDR